MTWMTGQSSSSDMFKILKESLDFYQERARTTAVYQDSINQIDPEANAPNLRFNLELAYVGLGLGEQGEIQGKIKKIIRDSIGQITDERKEEIEEELTDLLWYVAMTLDKLGLSFGEAAIKNLEKLQDRKNRGVLKGEGDNR